MTLSDTHPASEPRPIAAPSVGRAHAAEFKRAAARFASGVTVVTARHDGLAHGITVSAFASFCLDPLQVLVSIYRENRLHSMITGARSFAVSILREDQRAISEYFATPGRAPCDAFPGVACHSEVTGAPLISGSLAHFDCVLTAAFPGSDHTIFIGDVVAVSAGDGAPLVYFDRDYRGVREHQAACAAG